MEDIFPQWVITVDSLTCGVGKAAGKSWIMRGNCNHPLGPGGRLKARGLEPPSHGLNRDGGF